MNYRNQYDCDIVMKILSYFIQTFVLIVTFHTSALASEAGDTPSLKKVDWSFDGPLGKFDRQAAQRGFQVYKEVCSVCHGMNQLYYRNLKEIGFSEEEVAAIAASVSVQGGPDDKGEMYQRPGLPTDKFVSPYPNSEAARAANNGALPTDLSLVVKARAGGGDYIYSLLTGYTTPPEGFKMTPGLNYNPYFHGKQIAMPQPLFDGQVQYIDGTNATVDQMSRDIVVFLQWAAEPEMEKRKSIGMKSLLFLIIFTAVCFVAKNRIWSRLE
jgi:ubiquinol-cytochrome c reductase cytochrome c1 subunit